MATVSFTPHLTRFFPELAPMSAEVGTVAELIDVLEQRHKGLAGYLVDDHGALRKHVVIFVDREAIRDRERLSDPLRPASVVHVFQALSGG